MESSDNPSQLKERIKELEKENEQLRETELKFRAFYENAPLPYQSLDQDGCFIDVNLNWLKTLGYKREEVIGEYFGSFLHKDWNPLFEKNFPELKRREYIHHLEYRMKHKKGHYIDVLFEGYVGHQQDGTFRQTYFVFKDISQHVKDREQIASQKERLANIIEGTDAGTWEWNVQTGEIFFNERWAKFIGYTLEELSPITFDTWMKQAHPDDLEKCNKELDRYFKGETKLYECEHRTKHKDGSWIWLLGRGKVVSWTDDGKPLWMFGTHQNITERKQAKKELQVKNRISNIFINSESDNFYKEVLDVFREFFASEYGFFGYINEEGDLVAESMTRDVWDECQIKDKSIIFSKDTWGGLWGDALKEKKTLYRNGNLQFPQGHVQLQNAIAAPIVVNNKLIGEIVLANRQGGFNKRDKQSINNLCDYIAPLLHSKFKEDKYKQDLLEAKEKAEENEKKFSLLFNKVEDAIFRYDPKTYEIIEVNEATSKLYGYKHDELIGMSALKFSAEVDKSKSVTKKALQKGKAVVNLRHHKTKDGADLFLQLQAHKIVVNNQPITYAVCHDTTENVKYEQDLKAAKEKAEESDRLKSAFLANMSHEIRTPMNGIIGFSQMLQDKEYPREKQKEFLGIIHSRALHLLNIINDLVDLSKIEANQLSISPEQFNLNDLMQDLHSTYKNQLENGEKANIQLKKNLGLNYRGSYIESDFQRLKQIMDNLLNNAIKYTDEGTIEFGYNLRDEATLVFFVKDTGIGIPSDKKDQVFERFRQVDNSITRLYEGTGLGLTISKNFVELLGGEMWVESTEGVGSVFYFTLPYKAQNTAKKEETEKNEAEYNWQDKTMLVVEDDPTSLEYLKEIIEPMGAELILKQTGEEGYQAFRDNTDIDLILMDIRLPDISGTEIIKRIRATNNEVTIIAQTAHAMGEDRKICLQAGADDYIAKPIEVSHLQKIINKYV